MFACFRRSYREGRLAGVEEMYETNSWRYELAGQRRDATCHVHPYSDLDFVDHLRSTVVTQRRGANAAREGDGDAGIGDALAALLGPLRLRVEWRAIAPLVVTYGCWCGACPPLQ